MPKGTNVISPIASNNISAAATSPSDAPRRSAYADAPTASASETKSRMYQALFIRPPAHRTRAIRYNIQSVGVASITLSIAHLITQLRLPSDFIFNLIGNNFAEHSRTLVSEVIKVSNTYKRTQSIIIRSFVDLLQKNDFKDISVCDILSRASVSRTTFYRYYEDKYLLLKDLLGYYLSFVTDPVKTLSARNIKSVLAAVRTLAENRSLFYALSKAENEIDLRKEILNVCKEVLPKGIHANENYLFICSTLVYTCISYISSVEFSAADTNSQCDDRALNVFLQSFSSLSA